MVHTVTRKLLQPRELANIKCLDYNQKTIDELNFASVKVHNEPPQHMALLEASAIKNGFFDSIIILERNESLTLIEGHHRSAIAWKHNMALDADLHHCKCQARLLDSFGLCEFVWQACREAQLRAGYEGWDWKKKNYGASNE